MNGVQRLALAGYLTIGLAFGVTCAWLMVHDDHDPDGFFLSRRDRMAMNAFLAFAAGVMGWPLLVATGLATVGLSVLGRLLERLTARGVVSPATKGAEDE